MTRYRSQIDEQKVLDAVRTILEEVWCAKADAQIRPVNPDYPTQLWIELPPYVILSFESIRRLQATLCKSSSLRGALYFYSSSMYITSGSTREVPYIAICANTLYVRPRFFRDE